MSLCQQLSCNSNAHVQEEHSQTLNQDQARCSVIKAELDAQLQSTQQQLAQARQAVGEAQAAERHAKQLAEDHSNNQSKTQVIDKWQDARRVHSM